MSTKTSGKGGSAFKPEPVRRPREQVETQLREAIFQGVFEQGGKLPSETDLAERFSVSRATVREALRSLASTGLISKVPGAAGGSFVNSFDHASFSVSLVQSMDNILRLGSISYEEVAKVREMLEVPSAELAAKHRGKECLDRLDGLLAREKVVSVGDPEVPDLDVEFHSTIAAASGNRVLEAFVTALHRVMRPVLFVTISDEAGRTTVRQHRAIVKAIRSGKAEDSGNAMRRHLRYLDSLRAEQQS
jgi:DNA-binding FadR family transcriptional regulator